MKVFNFIFAFGTIFLVSGWLGFVQSEDNVERDEISNGPVGKHAAARHTRSRRAISSYSFTRENIPGTTMKTGTFYVLRMKRFPSGYVSWSSRRHASGYNYVFVDNAADHRPKYAKGGEWHRDTQWAFLSSKEPGWYHMINRAVPCQYATWSNAETIDSDGTFYMTIDPNHPGSHSEDDFLIKPYYPSSEIVDRPFYQLKIKSLPNAVVAWNAGNSSNESYYIHVESTDDVTWLRRYSWGHIWYDDTLFSFEEVNDRGEERFVDDDTEEGLINLGQQHHFETLVGDIGYGGNSAASLVFNFYSVLVMMIISLFL